MILARTQIGGNRCRIWRLNAFLCDFSDAISDGNGANTPPQRRRKSTKPSQLPFQAGTGVSGKRETMDFDSEDASRGRGSGVQSIVIRRT